MKQSSALAKIHHASSIQQFKTIYFQMKNVILVGLMACFLCNNLNAQNADTLIFAETGQQHIINKDSLIYSEIGSERFRYPQTLNKPALYGVIGAQTALLAGGLYYLTGVWYKDRDNVPFHFYNDNAGYLQIDKFGHAMTAYVESNLTYHAYRLAGMPKNKALIYGGLAGFFMQAPIEIADGLNEGWGFSWGDIAANTFGSLMVIGQEYFFDDQIVIPKFSFYRSPYADMAHGYLGNTFLESMSDDYNGHTYWYSANLRKMTHSSIFPRWLNVAAGYSAGGMFGEFENIKIYNKSLIPETQRYRQMFISLDVDWTRIPTKSKFLQFLFKGMNIIKIPFPALEYNTKGEFKGHWLYF
jgi:hypothetical protein